MIKTFTEYSQLNEGKQVGVIYHYTSVYSLKEILETNCLVSYAFDYISFTRDKNFHKSKFRASEGINGIGCRVVIDGDKLSNKYRVEPYSYYGDSKETDWPDSKFELKGKFESEERVKISGKVRMIGDLDRFVIRYEIFENTISGAKELAQELIDMNPKVKVVKNNGKMINEEVDASETYTDSGALQTLLDRKRDVALLNLDQNRLKALIKNNPGLKYYKVCDNPVIREKYVNSFINNDFQSKRVVEEYADTNTILYWDTRDGQYKAKKLLDLMHSKNGFIFGTTPREEMLIGKLLGYTRDSIMRFVEKNFKKAS